MKSSNRIVLRSSHVTWAIALALPFALSAAGCELIASVDRSQIPDGDGSGGEASGGGTAPSDGGEAAQGTSGASGSAAGDASGGSAVGGATGAGGEKAAGGESAQGGHATGAGGQSAEGGHATSAGGASGGADAAAGDSSGGGAGGETSAPVGKVIYLTGMPKKANFGGINGADAQCNASPPVAGSYKALLVDGSTRVACTSAHCETAGASEGVDWALAPNTTYVRADGTTVIGTTSSAAIFAFPLQASIGSSGGLSYWTGLDDDWTTSADNCSGWTATSGVFATEGLDNETDGQAISGVSESCATLAGAFFACVEQ